MKFFEFKGFFTSQKSRSTGGMLEPQPIISNKVILGVIVIEDLMPIKIRYALMLLA